MAVSWFINGGDPNYLLSGMILQDRLLEMLFAAKFETFSARFEKDFLIFQHRKDRIAKFVDRPKTVLISRCFITRNG